MKRALILLLFTPFSALAATVQIFGGGTINKPVATGSGWAVRVNKVNYIVTSEHVIDYGVNKFTFKGKYYSYTTVFSDYARGFAILKPAREYGPELESAFTDISLDEQPVVTPGQKLFVSGFPISSKDHAVQYPGEVLDPDSDRPFLPIVRGIVIVNSHGEFGMSGGPVFSEEKESGSSFVGLLSHQVLNVVPSQPSVIEEISTSPSQNLFLIPRAEIFAVLKGLSGASAPVLPKATRIANSRSTNCCYFLIGGLAYYGDEGLYPGGATPIGGFQSGGDGAGIGGEALRKRKPVNKVSVLLASASVGVSDQRAEPLTGPRAESLKGLDANLRFGGQAHISGFYKRAENGQLQVFRFNSMLEFVRLMLDPEMIPQIHRNLVSRDESKLEGFIQQAGADLFRLSGQDSTQDFRAHLSGIISLLTKENRWALRPGEFDELLSIKGHYKSAWGDLFARDYDGTVRLMTSLYQIQSCLNSQCK